MDSSSLWGEKNTSHCVLQHDLSCCCSWKQVHSDAGLFTRWQTPNSIPKWFQVKNHFQEDERKTDKACVWQWRCLSSLHGFVPGCFVRGITLLLATWWNPHNVHFSPSVHLRKSNNRYVCRVCILHKALSPTSDSDLRRSSDAWPWCAHRGIYFPLNTSKTVWNKRFEEENKKKKKKKKEREKNCLEIFQVALTTKHSNEFRRVIMHEISPWTKTEFNKAAKLLIKHVGGGVGARQSQGREKCEEELCQFLWEMKFSVYNAYTIFFSWPLLLLLLLLFQKNWAKLKSVVLLISRLHQRRCSSWGDRWTRFSLGHCSATLHLRYLLARRERRYSSFAGFPQGVFLLDFSHQCAASRAEAHSAVGRKEKKRPLRSSANDMRAELSEKPPDKWARATHTHTHDTN